MSTTKDNKRLCVTWFFLGLGSELQILASLSISELVAIVFSPFIFMRYWYQMKRDGVRCLFYLSIMVVLGAAFSCWRNQTPSFAVLRGMAVTCLIPCVIILSHYLLRRCPNGFRWFLLGAAISTILCTFVFHKSVEVSMLAHGETGSHLVDDIMGGPMFWAGRVGPLATLPTKGWYLHTNIFFDIAVMFFMTVFPMIMSVSGRSSALGAIAFICILLVGGKTRKTMKRLGRYFWWMLVGGVLLLMLLNTTYRILATKGVLGEDSQKKYEAQTQGDKSIKRLLLGGRTESFAGLIDCVEKPIVGWGPWATDNGECYERFVFEYGSAEDVEGLMRNRQFRALMGLSTRMLIPCHSHITEFWLWYGIFGLLFWLYAIYVLLRYIKQDSWAVPQWYAWLACSVGILMWKICFSPYSDRFGIPLCLVACLMARAYRKGRLQLPPDMQEEILDGDYR